MELDVTEDDPDAPDVRELLARHLEFARRVTPPGHVHALDHDGLRDPAVRFFAARHRGRLVGVGALRRLDADHAELKSMHVDPAVRGRGVGEAIVVALLDEAEAGGARRVSLETGTMEAFAPARRMYERLGFTPCAPFGDYTVNPYSVCMTITLVGRHTRRGGPSSPTAAG